MYNIIQQIEKFIIINFYPLLFLIFSILFGNIGGYISMIVATLSIMLAIILSINYKKKDKLFNIAKYYIIHNKSFENISYHYFDNPCSKIIIVYIIYKYERKYKLLEKYNVLKNHSTFNIA